MRRALIGPGARLVVALALAGCGWTGSGTGTPAPARTATDSPTPRASTPAPPTEDRLEPVVPGSVGADVRYLDEQGRLRHLDVSSFPR